MLQLPRTGPKRFALIALALFFILAGANHFANTDFYLRLMPDYLPAHLELVYVSGFFEIAGGVGVLVPYFRSIAGWGLVALLVAVYPANIHMALHPELFPEFSRSALYGRLPLQFALMAWAYWAPRPESQSEPR
jgi:uncharacterized membrane protein